MKDIADLTVTEIRFFNMDVIPFSSLLTVTNLRLVSTPYAFKNVDLTEDDNKNYTALHLKTGEFKHNNKIYPIELLIIERARIILRIKGDSDIAGLFYNEIYRSLVSIDQSGLYKKCEPIAIDRDTSCVAHLDIDYMDIFSEAFRTFLGKETVAALQSAGGKKLAVRQLVPKTLSFNVSYEVSNSILTELNISSYPKSLVIEPRIGVSFKEKRFFTASPADSKTHVKLISELEKKLKKK